MRPPAMAVRNQSSSAFELLSPLSPVVITKESGEPVAGPVRSALTRSMSETTPGMVSASWGRQEPVLPARKNS